MSHSIKGAEIFASGTHNGYTFTDADLDSIAASFGSLSLASRVPLKFGHNTKQPFTDGQPALGWVSRVWKEGTRLMADFVDMPQVVYNAIRDGLYKHVSVELLQNYSRDGSSHPWVLDAVALLGADIPAVRELKDLQALAMARQLPGVRFSRVATFTLSNTIIGAKSKMTDEEIKALEKRAADAESALATEKAKHFTEKVADRRKVITETLEAACKEGRIEPRARDRVLNSRLFKDDKEVLQAWDENALRAEIEANTVVNFKQKDKATSMSNTGEGDKSLAGKTIGEVVTFKAQAECVRMGKDPSNSEELGAATRRLFFSDKKLADAYFADQTAIYSADAAA